MFVGRALRLLLVGALIWLAAGAPARTTMVARAVAVLIAPGCPASARQPARQAPPEPRAAAISFPRPQLLEPVVATSFVHVEARYLRHCRLLS